MRKEEVVKRVNSMSYNRVYKKLGEIKRSSKVAFSPNELKDELGMFYPTVKNVLEIMEKEGIVKKLSSSLYKLNNEVML